MNDTAKFMFLLHSHVEIHQDDPDKIIYTEDNVVKLLKHFRIDPPDWTGSKGEWDSIDWEKYKLPENE